ncbi:MAG: hypothetical protein LBQ03_00755 [Puniceicoccales bacterium]|nr:hypothetical protein [Puniceicoccales bacterium]
MKRKRFTYLKNCFVVRLFLRNEKQVYGWGRKLSSNEFIIDYRNCGSTKTN